MLHTATVGVYGQWLWKLNMSFSQNLCIPTFGWPQVLIRRNRETLTHVAWTVLHIISLSYICMPEQAQVRNSLKDHVSTHFSSSPYIVTSKNSWDLHIAIEKDRSESVSMTSQFAAKKTATDRNLSRSDCSDKWNRKLQFWVSTKIHQKYLSVKFMVDLSTYIPISSDATRQRVVVICGKHPHQHVFGLIRSTRNSDAYFAYLLLYTFNSTVTSEFF